MKAETKEKTVLESNKLISEFMGPSEEWNDSRQGRVRLYVGIHGGRANCEAHELKYHSSWDWLMPAWRKVIDIIGLFMVTHGYDRLWAEKSIEIDRCITHEVNCREAAIQISRMIKWYNENKGS